MRRKKKGEKRVEGEAEEEAGATCPQEWVLKKEEGTGDPEAEGTARPSFNSPMSKAFTTLDL